MLCHKIWETASAEFMEEVGLDILTESLRSGIDLKLSMKKDILAKLYEMAAHPTNSGVIAAQIYNELIN